MLRKAAHDVVIVGGGVVGSSIAYHLSTMGIKNIVVIEKDSGYKFASAMLSAGGIRQQFSVKENVQMTKFGAEFLKNPSQLYVDGADPPDFQFQENGYLFLAGTAEGMEMLKKNNQTQRDCGVDWMELADTTGLAARFPW
jgi:FAD-dependent oxidoreductase domain-containing protein 1